MSYNVLTIPPFDRQLKRLVKKYPSLKEEYAQLIEALEIEPFQGTALSNSCYKIRVSIKSKGKGKSGGTRVITHVQITGKNVFLLTTYDKSEQEDITDKEIKYLLSFIEWNDKLHIQKLSNIKIKSPTIWPDLLFHPFTLQTLCG